MRRVAFSRLCGYPPFYSMKGVPLSPGMRSRIAKGYYAFPHEEWDTVSQASKQHISILFYFLQTREKETAIARTRDHENSFSFCSFLKELSSSIFGTFQEFLEKRASRPWST